MPAEPPIETPRSLDDALAILASATHHPIAGGTDVMVQITGELAPAPDRMIDLWRLDELRGISLESGSIVLGARTTYTEIRRSALCREHLPALVEAAATIGAAQIQNRGTIGGNIANASPAGDTLPVLLATDAEIVVGAAAGGPRGPVPEGRHAARPGDLEGRARRGLARARSGGRLVGRPRRAGLGRAHAGPRGGNR